MEEARKKPLPCGGEARKEDSRKVVMKLAGGLACQLRGGGDQALWRIDSGS